MAELADALSSTKADLEAAEHRLHSGNTEVENRLLLQNEGPRSELSDKITVLDGRLILIK